MNTINGCNIPDDLYYFHEKHVWAKPEGDLIVVGMNDVAQHLAGGVLSVTIKKVGRNVGQGKSVATMESSKWVGPVPAPVDGEIVEVNPDVSKNPKIINEDPYGSGWIVKLKAQDWEGQKASLASGAEGLETYKAFLDKEGIKCGP